jgi:predicted amidohydrolase
VAAAASVACSASAAEIAKPSEPERATDHHSGTIARIATVCQNGVVRATTKANLAYWLDMLDRVLKQKPDLVCFPEGFIGLTAPRTARAELLQSVPGPITDAFAQRAKEHRCYVICPLPTLREGKAWNTAVVIDRSGGILGAYDKVCPVTSSPDYTVFEADFRPGGEASVFDLDFGRIGIQICFDAGFPENWERLASLGAKAVFFPSAYDGGFPMQAYASLHHYYVITSVRTSRSRIIDPCGREVANTDERMNFVVRDVNLDFVVAHYDFNWGIPDRILDAYPGRVKITSYRDDAHFIVEPTDPALTTKQLRAEFGFEPASQYHQRHREAHAALRAGKAPTPQAAAHGNRGQYSK